MLDYLYFCFINPKHVYHPRSLHDDLQPIQKFNEASNEDVDGSLDNVIYFCKHRFI